MGKLISLIFILVFGWGSLGWADAGAAQATVTQQGIIALRAKQSTCVSAAAVTESCVQKANMAMYACLANFSPHVNNAVMLATALSAMSGTMSTSDACSKSKETMKKINAALALYNSACVGAKLLCQSSCGKALTAATNAASGATTGSAVEVTACSTNVPLITKVQTNCEGYGMNLAAAGAAAMAIYSQSNAAKQCEKDTTNVVCAPGDTRPACAQVSGGGQLDCSLAENAQKPECICQRFPNQAGCPGGGSGGGTGGVGSLQGNSAGAGSGSGFGDLSIEGGFDSTIPDVRGANGTGGGSGAGGGSGGGSGADGGAAAAKPTEAAKRMNTNILGGSDGGGGGGGRRGSASSDDSFRSSSLGAFLPGGAKDPNRGVASGGAAAAGISGAGGKSNWQKVNERYIDNRSGFLGDGP